MIKMIVFDISAILEKKSNIKLNNDEKKLLNLFKFNDDSMYILKAREIFNKDSIILNMTEEIIEKIYSVKEESIFRNIKKDYNITVILCVNHISFIRNFIGENIDINYFDDLLISSEIHMSIYDVEFYKFVSNKYEFNIDEILFIQNTKNDKYNILNVSKEYSVYEQVSNYISRLNNL